jgi:DMSO/TMAO reductase YedYZ heme-binding membrane subunit
MSTSLSSLPPTLLLSRPAAPAVAAAAAAPAPGTAERIVAGVLAAALAYALVRYVALGSVSLASAPAYLLNKALAVAALVLLALCAAAGPLAARVPAAGALAALRKPLGLAGFAFSAVHALLSAGLLSPAYYAKLHVASGRLSVWGELALTTGVFGLALLVLPALTSFAGIRAAMAPPAWKRAQTLSVTALALGGAHVAAMGWPTWTAAAAARWPGGLPPLTLVSFAVVMLAFAVRAAAPRR